MNEEFVEITFGSSKKDSTAIDKFIDFLSIDDNECKNCFLHKGHILNHVCFMCKDMLLHKDTYNELIDNIEQISKNTLIVCLEHKISEIEARNVDYFNVFRYDIFRYIKIFILKLFCAYFKTLQWTKVRYTLFDFNISILLHFDDNVLCPNITNVKMIKNNLVIACTFGANKLFDSFIVFGAYKCKRYYKNFDEPTVYLKYKLPYPVMTLVNIRQYVRYVFSDIFSKHLNKNDFRLTQNCAKSCGGEKMIQYDKQNDHYKFEPLKNDCLEINLSCYFCNVNSDEFIFAQKLDKFLNAYYSLRNVICPKCKTDTNIHLFGMCMKCISYNKTYNDIQKEYEEIVSDMSKIVSDVLRNKLMHCAYVYTRIFTDDLFFNEYIKMHHRTQHLILKKLAHLYDSINNDVPISKSYHIANCLYRVHYNALFTCLIAEENMYKDSITVFASEVCIGNKFRYDFYGKVKTSSSVIDFCIEIDDAAHLQQSTIANDLLKNECCARNNVKLLRVNMCDMEKIDYDALKNKTNLIKIFIYDLMQ